MRHTKALSTLLAVSAAITMLAGCGMTPGASGLSTTEAVGFDALASKTLKEGFKQVHESIFSKIDTNGDKYIDEYEAGPYFNLIKEFPKADKTKSGKTGNGKISRTEFMRYATAGGFLTGKDTPVAFLNRMRSFLATAFNRLDQREPGSGLFGKGDGYLTTEELGDKALAKLGLGFAYDKIHVRVSIPTFDPGDISAADKTGDGKLSQAEFEDLYMTTVVKAINPNYVPGGNAPAPAPADPAPAPAPAADPNAPAPAPTVEWWKL
ncbi:hypothetical protein J7643_18685 [bacterium]|nr:hypothetical protein [bacterium]